MDRYQRLHARGLVLPAAPRPVASYRSHVREGGLIYLSGQGPLTADGRLCTGKVGRDVSLDEAYAHARLAGMNLLAVLHEVLGDLARVKRIVKLLGMVNAAPDFNDHPLVINGCSDLFLDVFGPEDGSHARSAVGMGSLPGNITVEIEAIVAAHAPDA
ncbi:RidA family protein [Aquincola sp. S2]|uniref:RidA family protein n=1 Tax=Pseudaquabacterium terrae TaxID=2732868 RepID=A0ABX2EG90_9BURK|nr:RidA family protein [Aquabacterium terrae]NRF67649.1 RidA family protein [Aquabacterium terrae]